ncbi:MAG TPA: SOS response-associated peptidase [Candidatus Krumholzibacteria bacterium]|nr:SOS response-associated peptidase [Candidatus Krumholzibacteria bacterium]
MCGRFTLALSPEDIASLLRLNRELDAELGLEPRWNVAPSQPVLAAARPEPDAAPEPARFRWGLVPSWAETPAVGYRLINARAETVHEKRSFRDAFRRRRCLIPADGFYEWKRMGRRSRPWLFRPKDAPGFCFAGLWERWTPPGGGETLHTCAILTTEANALMAPIHDRMPVIVAPRDLDAWWNAEVGDPELARLLAPIPAESMIAHPVSDRVNDPRVDDAACVEPRPDAGEGVAQGSLF